MNDRIDEVLDNSWSPIEVSTSKALAKAILDPAFQESLKKMLAEFKSLTPKEYDGSGKAFVSMAQKHQLLEKHFEFGTFWFTTQFIDTDADAPICHGTLSVLTDEGYLPWFSRMGMPNPDSVSTDGKMADAENSATRRLMIGLGLGYEGAAELVDAENLRYIAAIREYLTSHGDMHLGTLVNNYKNHGGGLAPLKVKMDSKQQDKLSFNDLHQDDIKLLVGFVRRRGA